MTRGLLSEADRPGRVSRSSRPADRSHLRHVRAYVQSGRREEWPLASRLEASCGRSLERAQRLDIGAANVPLTSAPPTRRRQ
jgi:hypothetical protein